MKIIRSSRRMQSLASSLRKKGVTIGFVPTMGSLHEGHLSLVRRARRSHQIVVVSVFVNPAQFGPDEDFRQYPRDLERDASLTRKERVDFLFAPVVSALYPKGYRTRVEAGDLAHRLCGKSRPGHFSGVATVVSKLFHIIQPHTAYFGQKDYQQTVILRQMTEDLNFDVNLVVCPIVRDRDGLALSSRNVYLNREARHRALTLNQCLRWARSRIEEGVRDVGRLKRGMREILKGGLCRIDYAEVLAATDLSPLKKVSGKILIALAGFVKTQDARGRSREVRLIDNCLLRIGGVRG